jgi:hypothetical protein
VLTVQVGILCTRSCGISYPVQCHGETRIGQKVGNIGTSATDPQGLIWTPLASTGRTGEGKISLADVAVC